MKFIASQKLSNNSSLRLVMLWMLIGLIAAMGLNLIAKSIDYGTSPQAWNSVILGNPDEFQEPMSFNDLLLTIHTDLFSLVLIYILIASLYLRTSRSSTFKIVFLGISLAGLILYPLMLLTAQWIGPIAVSVAGGSFILFHAVMLLGGSELMIALLRRRL
ncbi:MAG: hypothetical protein PHW64_05430 [Sulfuricurvum sp.]|nr:hypothetical protein [Sulfuricurvum sp.]